MALHIATAKQVPAPCAMGCVFAVPSSTLAAMRKADAGREESGRMASDMKRDMIALLPRLRRFARSLTRNSSEADDLVQDACLRALSRAQQWDRSQPLDRWMFAITRNLWISEMRKRTVRQGEGHFADPQIARDGKHPAV
ncbi:MAG: RNA polymerase sigma factor [Pseudomonadota bacterium]